MTQQRLHLFDTQGPAHPGGGGAAAGLGQQPARSLVLVILRFQLDGSQPDLLAVGVSLTQREKQRGGMRFYWPSSQ